MTRQEKRLANAFLIINMIQSLILSFGLKVLGMTGWPMVAFSSFLASICCIIVIDNVSIRR